MLPAFNQFCRRLWRDESGMVLALTVVVFLTLFVIGCMAFAVGEHLRQRIELQNAADAAAYSGGVVQADTLGRIAAINKAMAWTYVQMGRAVMDYDVDAWLDLTLWQWDKDHTDAVMRLIPFLECPSTLANSWMGLGPCGSLPICKETGQIRINRSATYSAAQLRAMRASTPVHWRDLEPEIRRYRNMIKAMNQAEKKLRDELKPTIAKTVERILRSNVGYPYPEDVWYCWIATDAKEYFKTNTDEDWFLKYLHPNGTRQNAFHEGVDVWFRRNNAETEGIQRHYRQATSSLLAEYGWYLEGHLPTTIPPCGPPVYVEPRPNARRVRGIDAMALHSREFYETETVQPQILTETYFEPRQHVVVSVARKMRNPLAFMFQDGKPGLFGFFGFDPVGGKDLYSWAVTSARAGYRLGGGEGEYHTLETPGWLETPDNLSQWDWDSVLIPVHKTAGTQVADAIWDSSTPPPGEKLSDWWQLHGNGHVSGLSSISGGPGPGGKMLH